MQVNFLAILVASLLQFVFGAVWYSALFGKLWGKVHGFDKLSKDVQQTMMKEMAPYYLVQFLITIVTTVVLALFLVVLPQEWNPYGMAFFFWLGFVVPTLISAALFGGTQRNWIVTKVAVQAGASLGCLEIAAFVLLMMK